MSAPVADASPPLPTPAAPELPKPRALHAGLRLNIRGRSVRLRRLRTPPAGPLAVLALLGPGLIAAFAGDDAGGIATYSQVGAQFGYDLLWMLLLITISLAVVQEMCARLGAATGRGLLDLVRERYGISWAMFAIAVILVANGGVLVTEFVGLGAALELFGISRYVVVPAGVALVAYLVLAGSYAKVEKVFVAMTLAFLTYPISCILAHPDWGAVVHGAVVPTIKRDPAYMLLLVGTIGTTLTPYMQIFQQSSAVDKGTARRHYGPERVDAYAGAILSNIISACILVATAATLHHAGKTDISSAADAAQALRPVAGDAAEALFAIGLVGASLLAAAVLPLATAYSVSEAFGFRKGVDLDFRRAPVFQGLFVALLVIGAGIALIPGVPVIQLLVGVQVLNGVLLPCILVFILLLCNDVRLVGDLRNGRVRNIVGWGTFALVTAAVVVLLGSQALGAVGIHPFGG